MALTLAGCGHSPDKEEAATNSVGSLPQVASFQISPVAKLRLYADSATCMLVMMSGDEVQDIVGEGNTQFETTDDGRIILDTLLHTGWHDTVYLVRTYDRSSTYGAKVWYVAYPWAERYSEGPWVLTKLPLELPDLKDVDGDGIREIIEYENCRSDKYTVYAFEAGMLREVRL